MQRRLFTLRQKSILVKIWLQFLGAGWRWAWLRLHSLGINLPLPAVITAKRPTGTTPRIRLNSVFILYALLWLYIQNIIVLWKKKHTLYKLLEMMRNADPSQLEWQWNDTEFARQKRNKGRGRWESRRMQTTGSPLCELCWGWESERRLIAALVELPGLSSPSLLTDDTAEGKRELAWGKEEREAPLWVYKFTSYPWPNTQTVSSMRRPIITPAALSPCFFISFSPIAQNPQSFIKWPTVLAARPGAKQLIDPKSLFK